MNNVTAVVWTGESWQKWVNKLIKMRHEEHYRIISDKDMGDGGLEGFTTCGKAYQCYSPEASVLSKWKESVQGKINDDLQKLKKNSAILARLLGGIKIKSWHLVVPEDKSKDLMAHCNAKAIECREWNIPILASDFMVTLETEANWPGESSSLQHARAGRIDFKVPRAESTDLSQWQVGNAEHFQNVKRKCTILVGDNVSKQEELEQRIIQCYIEGQNALATILAKFPDIYENIIELKEQKERYLFERTISTNGQNAITVFNDVIADMKSAIKSELPNASDRVVEAITREATSDWLIRCPLNFKGA